MQTASDGVMFAPSREVDGPGDGVVDPGPGRCVSLSTRWLVIIFIFTLGSRHS